MKKEKTCNEHDIKVSVVVPIYGVEDYLRECVDSILAQTLQEIEIILVDDGSPDGCPQIVDEYAKKDPRVVAVHQKNGGYGKAVNHGFDLARGEYVGIVESDDFIEPEMYEKLYVKAKKYDADVSKGSFYEYNPAIKNTHRQKKVWPEHKKELFPCPDSAFCLRDYPKIVMSHSSIWSMIYRRDFITQNCLRVAETAGSAYQDFLFMVSVMSSAQKIVVCKEALYNWRSTRQGNSTGKNDQTLLQMPQMNMAALQLLQEKGLLEDCKKEIYCHILRTNQAFFWNIKWEYKARYFDLLEEIFRPLSDDQNFSLEYFRYNEKQLIRHIWRRDFLGAAHKSAPWPVIRRSLISKRLPEENNGKWQVCLLGMQIGTMFDWNLYSWVYIKIK